DLTEQLNYAHRNMLPRVQIALRRDEFHDFATSELLASRIEVSCKAATNYRVPPAPEKSLFPELTYGSPRKASRGSKTGATGLSAPVVTGNQKVASRGRVSAVASGPSTATVPGTSAVSATTPVRPASAVKYWNCEEIGHIARECGERRRTYCFRCGRPDVTVKACPTCSGNAEESR
ncbi:Gag-Pol polyprotein, partial [Trachymyrmex zeteki]